MLKSCVWRTKSLSNMSIFLKIVHHVVDLRQAFYLVLHFNLNLRLFVRLGFNTEFSFKFINLPAVSQ